MNKLLLRGGGVVYLLFVIFLAGCSSYGNKNDGQSISHPFINEQNFKLTSLTYFMVDSFLNNKPVQLIPVDSATKWKFFSSFHGNDTVCEDPAVYGDVYYYSWQPNNRNQVEFTLLVRQESGVSDLSSTQIRYVALDPTGKLLYNFIAAEKTNYRGLNFVQYKGEFTGDSMFKKTKCGNGLSADEVTYILHHNHTVTF